MKISEILKKEFIIADLEASEKLDVLKELSGFLSNKGIIKNQDALNNALMERERLGSTGIGDNVAIPHAKSDEINQIISLFGRSTKGVEFESLDQKPVHFVCLLLAPVNSTGLHLKALARISRLLKSSSIRDAILKAHDVDGIYSILIGEDSKFI